MWPGNCPVSSPFETITRPLTIVAVHALAPRLEPADAAGQVVHELLAPRADRRGIEHHQVGPTAGRDRAPVGEAQRARPAPA